MEFILDEANGNGDRVATSAYGPEGFVSLNLDGAGARQLWHQLGLALVKLDEDEKARMQREADEAEDERGELGRELDEPAEDEDLPTALDESPSPSPNEVQAAAQEHTSF